jgi:hypothetical protein
MLRITPIDNNAAQDGAWTVYRGVDLKIARAGNDRFAKHFMSASRPHRQDIDKGRLDTKTAERIMCESMAEGILMDWKNLKVGDQEVEYSKTNAFDLLKNDPDCRDFVQEFARELNNFIEKDKDETAAK